MAFVLDASVAMGWAFPDERSAQADAARDELERDGALVPALWWLALANALVVNERRGRIAEPTSRQVLRAMESLPIRTDLTPDLPTILSLARRHRLSAYDAAYLELAQRMSAPLATLDAALARAAQAEQVALLAPTGPA